MERNSELTVEEIIERNISEVEDIECKVDEDKLNQLMDLCKAEYPHIPDYFIYVYSVDYLMSNHEE